MSYEALRHFADSWGLLFLGIIFLTMIGWTFRPGSGRKHEEAAHMIFEEDHEDG
ncbi:cbb3-type cytochrome c oxidase subunit 3 [Sphingorhabdus sp. EL138]|jgi:cytochrome c oxidase cbb3-type subunit 4|uniref:cbb3-type cytochrome c oxidase subunit 3 n=1 Tax=Sphingorhabdus sp. EL138 TaxID=2073156 RepID=UPI000D69CB0E|nr:cbb3-type cytochrome c oxidase subunit 3 [Sphingorhabdus sp. EL138]